jgi:hypothetical protein
MVSRRETSDRLSPFSSRKSKVEATGKRFCNAGPFNKQVVEASLFAKLASVLQEVVAQRAADTAIGHLDQLLFGSGQIGATVAHEDSFDTSLISLTMTATRRPSRLLRT